MSTKEQGRFPLTAESGFSWIFWARSSPLKLFKVTLKVVLEVVLEVALDVLGVVLMF